MKITKYIIKIFRGITHISDYYYRRIKPILRHRKYPMCHFSAIVYKPLSFNPAGVKLDKNVTIYKNARIGCVFEYANQYFKPTLEIGEGTSIQQNAHITCASSIKIGEYCAITHNVTITDIDHSYEYDPYNYPPPITNKLITNNVAIGRKCMIFPNSVILGGSKIGNNCIIGANSVVRGEFPDNCVIVGAPAYIVKRHNPISKKWGKTNHDGSFKK